jgi:hypothetical protein
LLVERRNALLALGIGSFLLLMVCIPSSKTRSNPPDISSVILGDTTMKTGDARAISLPRKAEPLALRLLLSEATVAAAPPDISITGDSVSLLSSRVVDSKTLEVKLTVVNSHDAGAPACAMLVLAWPSDAYSHAPRQSISLYIESPRLALAVDQPADEPQVAFPEVRLCGMAKSRYGVARVGIMGQDAILTPAGHNAVRWECTLTLSGHAQHVAVAELVDVNGNRLTKEIVLVPVRSLR